MRSWPTRWSGLQLTLPSGWYELPWYMPPAEVRRMLDLLLVGLDGVDYAVELEWAGLDALLGRANFARSVVALRVPGSVEVEAITRVQPQLGDVHVGLVLREVAQEWTKTGWQQRHIKIPLLTALRRELHLGQHPFAGLGIELLPLDEIAALTDEPVELLELFDAVVAHRLRHAAHGLAATDWRRSFDAAVTGRLAARLANLPPEQQLVALELALDARDQPMWLSSELPDHGMTLMQVGLASREGDDLLVGSLARRAGEPAVLRGLLEVLPAGAWSDRSVEALRGVLPKGLPLPRAVVTTPEPDYADWPVVELVELIGHVMSFLRNHGDQALDTIDFMYTHVAEGPPRPSFHFLHDTDAWRGDPRWLAAFDAIRAVLLELADDALLELDFARGRIHRFDAMDRALSGLPGGADVGALIRLIGVLDVSRRTHDHGHLAILAHEIETALAAEVRDTRLEAALHCTLGDLWATRHRHAEALRSWRRVELEEERLILRIMLAMLRLGTFGEGWADMLEFFGDRDIDSYHAHEQAAAAALQLLLDLEPASHFGGRLVLTTNIPTGAPLVTTCQAAIAVEHEDWPRAIHLLDAVDRTSPTPQAAHARLLWAWTCAALGELDVAAAAFDELHQLASSWHDELLTQLAEHGRSWVAGARSQAV